MRDENGARQDELGRLAMPVLLLWGERDIAYTLERVAARFAADIPEATLRTVAAGHYPHEERPADYVRELSAFLDDADAAREPQEPR